LNISEGDLVKSNLSRARNWSGAGDLSQRGLVSQFQFMYPLAVQKVYKDHA